MAFAQDVEIKTKQAISQKLAVGFMLGTALVVMGTVLFAAAYTFVINTWGENNPSENESALINTDAGANTNVSLTNETNQNVLGAEDRSFTTENQ